MAAFVKKALSYLKSKHNVSTVHEWTDCAAGKYKDKYGFADLSMFSKEHGMPVIHNFFETSHGKGPCDGLGGIVKNKASKEVLSSKAIIQNAKDLVNFCNENLGNVGASNFASHHSKYDHIYVC